MLMFKKTKIRISFLFCVTALIFLSGELRKEYLCAMTISLMHESGHLMAMCFYGIYPESVCFTPTGIRINCPGEIVSCRAECVISASGPLVNLILMPFLYFFPFQMPFYLNTGLLMINLLPLKSLDSGRFLYNLIMLLKDEPSAERMMNVVEVVVCIFLVVFLIAALVNGIYNQSFVLLTVMLVASTIMHLLH